MADAVHSKCIAERRGSSSLPSGTTLVIATFEPVPANADATLNVEFDDDDVTRE